MLCIAYNGCSGVLCSVESVRIGGREGGEDEVVVGDGPLDPADQIEQSPPKTGVELGRHRFETAGSSARFEEEIRTWPGSRLCSRTMKVVQSINGPVLDDGPK